jgi:hypothetical protein
MSVMDKAYKSKNYDAFLTSGEKYQKGQKMKDSDIGDDVKGTMEKPVDGFKQNSGLGKKVMDQMKYAPKTVSYAEFTNAKRNAKLQSMVGAGTKDESSKEKMESFEMATLPAHKREKSFDIDVTDYKPRKAKG